MRAGRPLRLATSSRQPPDGREKGESDRVILLDKLKAMIGRSRGQMNITVVLGCANGHSWFAAAGVTVSDQKSVSINLAHLGPVCPGCGEAVSLVRVRMD
jgi:hypothetical protein